MNFQHTIAYMLKKNMYLMRLNNIQEINYYLWMIELMELKLVSLKELATV